MAGLISRLVELQVITEFQGKGVLAGLQGPYKLGPYRVYDRIAAGRLGSVYRAVHDEFSQPVSLKLFPPTLNEDEERRTRLARETRVAAQVEHPNVVRTFQIGRLNGVIFLAFEDLEGESLASRLERDGRLPVLEACKLVREAAMALAHLHSLDIVLRDIQPANIWITAAGHAKLMEFGAARDALSYLDCDSPDGITGVAIGSDLLGDYDYMSPEQGADPHGADFRSDIYALGCVLFHCLTGEVVFPDSNLVRKMLRHAREPVRFATEIDPEIPKAVSDIVETMLAKEPEDRYQTASDVVWALEQEISEEETLSAEVADIDPGFLEWAQSTSELAAPTEIHTVVAEPEFLEFFEWVGEQDDESLIKDVEPLPAERKAVESLKRLDAEIKFDDEGKVRSVDLGLTTVSNAKLSLLKDLSHLQTLALRRTRVSDAGLEHVGQLKTLRWLSLTGTSVTDKGLERLHGLSNLERLFLEGTKVTSVGTTNLKQAIPDCEIQ